jgi:hypothetical protein
MASARPRGWRTSEPGQSPSPEKRIHAPPPACSTPRGSLAGASEWGRSKEGHRMQALCKYCRTMTTPAPSHPGRPRLCSNCLRPYERGGETLPAALGSPSLPTQAPEQRARAGGDQDAPRATPTGADAICPYLRDRNNEQTVHLTPQKRNACYARLRQQDHWWSPSPWVASTPTPVTRQYQACCCFETYVRCPSFRPVGTPEAQTTNPDKLSGRGF